MITVTKQSNSVLFEFENNPHYLQQGTMEVPFNSLILVEDESDMITFRKASTNDILFSAMFTEFSSLGNTKDAVVSALEDMMFAEGGGGGVDPEDVVEIVESALTDYWTSAQTQSAINQASSGKQDTLISGTNIKTINNQSLLGSGNITISGGGQSLEFYSEDDVADSEKIAQIETADNGGAANGAHLYVQYQYEEGANEPYASIDAWTEYGNYNTVYADSQVAGINVTDGTDTTNFTVEPTAVTINNDAVATQPYVNAAVSGKADTSAVTQSLSAKQDTLVSGTNIKTINNQSLLGSGNITISGGGSSNIVELTQAQYDALVSGGTVDPDTLYIISDATEINVSGYALSSAVTAEISAAVSGKADTSAVTQSLSSKQDTLVSGTNIKTINNESLLGSGNIDIQGGGGATYSAGTNISIDTANTISCTLPITAGTYGTSVAIGLFSQALNGASLAVGQYSKTNGGASAAIGDNCQTKNTGEFACGLYNTSNTGTSNANRTLFSVGNGTSDNARKNALEIRQNGDIYVKDGTNDVKLQDTITGTTANTTALGGLKFVSLTQSEYDQLATKDSATIYFIKNNSN